jgi:RNA polymerase sigma factor (sigma-70 family)
LKIRISPLPVSPGTPQDDEALIAGCAKRDSNALGTLFDRHDNSVRRFLARVCQIPGADLDDLVHATFVEVYRSAHAFRGQASAKTWIFGIAVNVARHHARSEARRHRFLTTLAGQRRLGAAPQETLEHRHMLARMGAALGELPYARRAAFALCELEGMTTAEAGSVLDVRPGTIGRWLHEARKSLRAAIEWNET